MKQPEEAIGSSASQASVVQRRCGAVAHPNGTTRWRVWAPAAGRVELLLTDAAGGRERVEMRPEPGGTFALDRPGVPEGQRYHVSLDGGPPRPDPCSLWQPDAVDGPSAVYYPERFGWTDHAWRGVARADLVFYELHVGTFTPAGTFEAAIDRLDDLVELGVTAVELMPVGQFPGGRNWGYDGVLPYAAQNTYGGPRGLQRLVDAAHAKGLAVFLDVVYNHFGPEHAYFREFGPYFTDAYKTPWGAAVNYDGRGCDGVRAYVLDNARMWLDEFHLDGLRLDAVHAIYDLGATHILREIHVAAEEVAGRAGRRIAVVAESDLNDPRVVSPVDRGGHGIDAQWADDFHHAVHSFLTGERRGYYSDYGEAKQIVETLRAPFLNPGGFSRHRGRRHGAPPDGLSGDQFVVCVQNHDQVGNRAVGDRLSTILAAQGPHGGAKQRLAAGLMLLSPYLPLLFMGEEYGETNPFPFFCSFCGPELIEAVRQGRKREFADFVDSADDIPDPAGEATFAAAKLSWSWPAGGERAGLRRLYKDLLAARRAWPGLRDPGHARVRGLPTEDEPAVVELVRGDTARAMSAYFNLTAQPQPLPPRDMAGGVLFTSEAKVYAGSRGDGEAVEQLKPYECAAFGVA